MSGRPLADIDAFLAPLCLPAAGAHGTELREGDGVAAVHAWLRASLDREAAA